MNIPPALVSIVAAAATLSVVIVLIIGLVSMMRGGDFNARNANRLMRLRVLFQGIAVLAIGALMLLFLFAR